MREMQWRIHGSFKQPVDLKFELMLILLIKQRNKETEKLLRICLNNDKSALFICVCFSDRDHERYEGGDSNRTICFEWPKRDPMANENCRNIGIALALSDSRVIRKIAV